MERCNEREICSIDYMKSDEKKLFNDWYLNIAVPIWIDAHFESLNIPVDGPHQKTLFVSKPVGVCYNIVKSHIKKT